MALAAGVAIAWLDTRPGFDDTRVLVGLLVVAAAGASILDGTGSAARGLILGALVGGPTPLLEVAGSGQVASVIALVVALAAALVSALAVRVAKRPDA